MILWKGKGQPGCSRRVIMEVRKSKSVSLLRCWSWIVVATQDERKKLDKRGVKGWKERLLAGRWANWLIEEGTKFHLGRDEWQERAPRERVEEDAWRGCIWVQRTRNDVQGNTLLLFPSQVVRNFSRLHPCTLLYIFASSTSRSTPASQTRFMRPAFFPSSELTGWLRFVPREQENVNGIAD